VVIVYSVGLIQPAEFRAIRSVRTMEFRWALIAARRARVRYAEGHRGGDHRLDDRLASQTAHPHVYVIGASAAPNVLRHLSPSTPTTRPSRGC